VIFTTFSQSPLPAALFTWMAGIPLRLAHCRENPYQLLTHWVLETDHFELPTIRHEVRRQLDLVEAIGCRTTNDHLSLCVPASACERIKELLTQFQLDQTKPWVVLHPGATAPSRRYPPEGFAEVAQTLASEYQFQIVFTGTEAEIELVEMIRTTVAAQTISLAGKLDMDGLSALISIAPVLVSNNTGPAHIAAALNTPIVDLYALTNPQHTPWNVPHRTLYHDVPCKYCYKSVCPMGHHNCLRLVHPRSVVEATLELSSVKELTNSSTCD
jgi:lipopolysaccharide heptosyltransferase II